MTLQEYIEEKGLKRKRICEHIEISPITFSKYEKRNSLHDLTITQGIKLCAFVGISKQEFIKGNIKPLKVVEDD